MTRLAEVLVEEWRANGGQLLAPRRGWPGEEDSIAEFYECPEETTRAAVAVLGKRALAMVLKHEWTEDFTAACPECLRMREKGHTLDCEWGRIIAAAKEIE